VELRRNLEIISAMNISDQEDFIRLRISCQVLDEDIIIIYTGAK